MGNCLGGEADHNGLIIPNACWVIKTKTVEANSKVFINVVSHANIPKSSNPDEPRIFVGSKKLSRDQKVKSVQLLTYWCMTLSSMVLLRESGIVVSNQKP